MTKAILFDVDGTLLDTTEYIYQAFEHNLDYHKLEIPHRTHLSQYIGKPLKDIYAALAPEIEYEVLRERHDNFQVNNLHLAKVFPNVFETLTTLKSSGIRISAVTTRGKVNVLNTMKQTGLIDHFEVIITGDDVINHKPDPEPLMKAMELLSVSPDDVYMVGDADVDILAGKNAKVKTIGVTFGFGGKGIAQHNPDYLVDSFEEILKITT